MDKRKMMRWIKYLIGLCLLGGLVVIGINLIVIRSSDEYIFKSVNEAPGCYTGLVLGAKVNKAGSPTDFLQDRLDVALELYYAGKIKRFLLSGDHGQKEYDEVNSMKKYLLGKGIDTKDIFLDHAGFDTYNSVVRAKEIFQVNDVIVITQEFHLSRAVYIARQEGLNAYGVIADRHEYAALEYLKHREIIANVKAFSELLIERNPKYSGDTIPIKGDSRLSFD